jgi:hypothetical protein
VNCSQKSVSLENIEKQIDSMLSSIEIIDEFKNFALEELKIEFEKDSQEKIALQKNLQLTLGKTEKKLKNLTEALI